jgi:cytochrome P450
MIPIALLSLLALIAGVYYLFFKGKKSPKNPSCVKTLSGYPLIGSVFNFIPENIVDTCERIPQELGPFVEFYILGYRGFLISDAEVGKEILSRRPKKFRRSSLIDYCLEVLNLETGLFGAEGQVWSRIRKQTHPSFSHSHLSQKYSAVTNETFQWIKRIHDHSQSHPTTPMNMRIECFSLTVRVITIVAFGLDIHDPLCSYFLEKFAEDAASLFVFIGESALYPYPMWTWKYSPQYKYEVEARKANDRFTAAGLKIIQQKRALLKDGKLAMNCMIDSLIAHHEKSATNDDKEKDKDKEKTAALTDEEIIANVKMFFIAGADTTAITLAWLCYYFSCSPEILQEVENETKKVLLKDFDFSSLDSSSSDSFEKNFETLRSFLTSTIDVNVVMKQLPYMNAVIREGLRVGSPSNFIDLESISEEPIVLSNGIVIEHKDLVFVNQDGVHFSPNCFPNPREFLPSRWLNASGEKEFQELEKNYFPFGSGPRICPGMSLAMNELYLAIAILSLFFTMRLDCPKEEIKRVNNFVTVPNKMPIVFLPKKTL